MEISAAVSPVCESCAMKKYSKDIKGRRGGNQKLLFSMAICVLYMLTTLAVPVQGVISSGRQNNFDIVVRALGDPGTNFAGQQTTRRRRSARERDFTEFRKLLHQLRNNRRGRKNQQDANRRNSFTTLSERSSTANTIAKNVNCGACQLNKQWIPVSKPGCRTNFVLAPTCMGMCETWQIPDVNPPYVTTYHRVCRPTQLEFRKIRLRRCQPGVNAFHVVPVAKNCACMKCRSVNTACRPL